MNSLLMWIGGVMAAILAALFAVPYFVDWNGYRGVFEEEASRILGRDVRVGGKVNLRLLPTPYLRFEKLRISDVSGTLTGPLFQADNFTLWLSVPPLLQGNLDVRHIALDKPVFNLSVDENGRGNWTSFEIRPGTLPFVPQKVALKAVQIEDGTLIINHPRAGVISRLEAIAGQVSAEALDGPYKFAGDVTVSGVTRDVRIATAKAETDGTVRFKATAQPKSGVGTSYRVDGSLLDAMQAARIDGAFAATVPLPELPGVATASALPEPQSKSEKKSVYADVKGRLKADASGVDLADVVASIENVGQPQLLTGAAGMRWGDVKTIAFEAASRWLDLDNLAGSKNKASPVATSVKLIEGLVAALPKDAATRGTVAVDQVTLGDEALASVDLAVSREMAGPIKVERLFAALPAGARFALDGVLTTQGDTPSFEGHVTAAGPSLGRVVSWALPDHPKRQSAPDRAFEIDGDLSAGAAGLTLDKMRASFADHPISGRIALSKSGALNIAVEAATIETDWLWQGGLTRTAFLSWIDGLSTGAAVRVTGDASQAASPTGTGAKLALILKTNVLRGPDRALRNVVADIDVDGQRLDIKRLAFRSAEGLVADVGGAITRESDTTRGSITGTLNADRAASLETLMAMIGAGDSQRVRQLSALLPLRIAGEIALGRRGATTLDIKADGAAASGRISLAARLDGGLNADWREAPAELTVSAEEASAEQLVALMFADPAAGARGTNSMIANAAIKAVGVPAKGMVTDAALSRSGLSLAYNGSMVLDDRATPSLSGSIEVAADRLSDVMALAGISRAGGSGDVAVNGTVGLNFEDDGRLKLTPSGLTISGSEVSGALRLARADAGRLRIDGDIAIDQATIPGLLQNFVTGAPRPLPVSASDVDRQSAVSLWTDQTFSDDAFQHFDGRVGMTMKRLGLGPGLGIASAKLNVEFSAGAVEAAIEGGHVLGGKLTGRVKLAKAAAGARIETRLSIEGVALEALSQAASSTHAASGGATIVAGFAGQALSPRSLVSSVRGEGTISFNGVTVVGFTPNTVADTAAAAFAKDFAVSVETLEQQIQSRLPQGRLEIGSREVPISIGDGVAKLARFVTQTENGTVETIATVDLATLDAETEWRLLANSSRPGKPAWPPVSIYYTSPLGKLAGLAPRIALGSFDRELTVRRMEYEVEELERLRKLDEERARVERERQKALAEAARLERERLKAAEAEQRRLKALQRTAPPPTMQPDAPNQPAPATIPGRSSANDKEPGWTADSQLAPTGQSPANQSPGPGNEPAAAALPNASAQQSGVVAETIPSQAAPEPVPATTPPQAEQPRVRRHIPRRNPSAGDTLLKSLNPFAY